MEPGLAGGIEQQQRWEMPLHQNAINCLQRALFISENTLNMNWKQFA
ncbi:hypothetical protein [Massilia sp. X63]|jgi:hypothetical protein